MQYHLKFVKNMQNKILDLSSTCILCVQSNFNMQMYEVLSSGYVYSDDLYLNMEKQT